MRIKNVKMIDVSDWDELVSQTYGKMYSFQQQDGCKERGLFRFTVPEACEEYENDSVPEIVNHGEMGVSFGAWLKRDPKAPLVDEGGAEERNDLWAVDMWWERNFYPEVQMIANDLHEKGLLEAGDYTIDIDW